MLTLANRATFATLHHAAALQVADDTPAIIFVATGHEPMIINRRDFLANVIGVALSLREIGIRARDLVVIAHTQDLESIYGFWGALWLGAIPSMFPTLTEKLDPDVYQNSISELVRLSSVSAVITTDEFAPQLHSLLPCPVVGSSRLAAARSAATLEQTTNLSIDPHEIAFLQHSSGTTGLQKGIALSHNAALNQIAAYSEVLRLSDDDVIVSWLPLYHDMGLIAGFLLPLIQGIPLVLMSPFDWVQHPVLLLRAIHEYKGTLSWLPNFAYNHCARRIRRRDSEGLSLASIRLLINCSEPVRHESHQLFLDRFAENGLRPDMLGVSYAMAENTFAVTQTSPGCPARLDIIDRDSLEIHRYAKSVTKDHPAAQIRVSCGPPLPNTEIRVFDEAGHPLPERYIGQLGISSNCLLTGYYNRPDLDPFQAGWYLTGDLGYLADGEVYVIGRSKDLIINAGKNIYPQDIEAIVNEIPGVHAGRAVVFGVLDEREGTELIAVVAEVKPDDTEERRDIARAIRQQVARQTMVTVTYVHLVGSKWLLKTSSGKIARGASRDKWLREIQQKGSG